MMYSINLISGVSQWLQDRNQWLLLIFLIYMCSIFIFASIYFYLYIKRPRSFAFNADVLRKQSEDFKDTAERFIEGATKEVAYFTYLLQELNRDKEIFNSSRRLFSNEDYIATRQYRYQFITIVSGTPMGSGSVEHYVDVFDDDKKLGRHSIPFIPETAEQTRRVIEPIVDNINKQIMEQRRRLDSLSSDWPEVWSFWDFLYFSTITQTTVGYGDILPNKTVIRILVTVQILVGLLMIGFLINIVFSTSTK